VAGSNLFEDDSMAIEFLSSVGGVLDLGRHGEPKGGQLPHFSQEGDQLVPIVDPQLPILVTQLHELATCLEAGVGGWERRRVERRGGQEVGGKKRGSRKGGGGSGEWE